MGEMMVFPRDWAKFLDDYSFRDHEEIYTNGSRLIPTFRVEQMMHHYLRQAVSEAIAALREQDATDTNVGHKWISVEERLPEEDEDVLIWLGDCDGFGIGQLNFCGEVSDFWARHFKPTHWMPLPEPPKEES